MNDTIKAINFKLVKMADKVFSKYLENRKWKGNVIKAGKEITSFIDTEEKTLAILHYDNENSTAKIYIPE